MKIYYFQRYQNNLNATSILLVNDRWKNPFVLRILQYNSYIIEWQDSHLKTHSFSKVCDNCNSALLADKGVGGGCLSNGCGALFGAEHLQLLTFHTHIVLHNCTAVSYIQSLVLYYYNYLLFVLINKNFKNI